MNPPFCLYNIQIIYYLDKHLINLETKEKKKSKAPTLGFRSQLLDVTSMAQSGLEPIKGSTGSTRIIGVKRIDHAIHLLSQIKAIWYPGATGYHFIAQSMLVTVICVGDILLHRQLHCYHRYNIYTQKIIPHGITVGYLFINVRVQ